MARVSAYNDAGFRSMFVLTGYLHPLIILLFGLLARSLPAEGPIVVEGTVTNRLTGAPVKGVHVIYTGLASGAVPAASPISRDTDMQGHFHLELAPGSYRLWVEREGFARQHYGSPVPESPGIAAPSGDYRMQDVPQGKLFLFALGLEFPIQRFDCSCHDSALRAGDILYA